MPQLSQIEWTDATWNPVTGCTKVSPGCKFCYAERMADRLHAMGQHRYRNRFRTTLQPDLLERRCMVDAADRLRELDERPVPLATFRRITSGRVRHDEASRPASVPGADQASGSPPPDGSRPPVARESLDGRQCREPGFRPPRPRPPACSRSDTVPFGRAPSGADFPPASRRHRLGHRRRRIRARGPTHEVRMGPRDPRLLRRPRRIVLLQTMGWREEEAHRSDRWMAEPGTTFRNSPEVISLHSEHVLNECDQRGGASLPLSRVQRPRCLSDSGQSPAGTSPNWKGSGQLVDPGSPIEVVIVRAVENCRVPGFAEGENWTPLP